MTYIEINKRTLSSLEITVSFITICYNGLEDTCVLIDSILSNIQSVTYEIIVIDNASSADEASILQKRYPSVITIRSEKNLGFSGGNNLGIKKARGDYLFFINNDTYVLDDKINFLINRLKQSNNLAGLSPKIKYAYPPYHIQYAGFTPLSRITLRNATIGDGEVDRDSFNEAKTTPYLHGAAMLIKKEIIDIIGPMPEIYFLYYEEIDWCTQMTDAGYQLYYDPAWTVFHKESKSTGGNKSATKVFYMTRNRLLYAWRNYKGVNKILSIIYQLTIAATKNIMLYLKEGRWDLIQTTTKAIYHFFILPNKKK